MTCVQFRFIFCHHPSFIYQLSDRLPAFIIQADLYLYKPGACMLQLKKRKTQPAG